MKRLVMTVGLPRCGKTTWARRQNCPIVNPDSIRLAVHGKPFEPKSEGLVWWVARIMVDSLFEVGHDVVVLDATSITVARRSAWKDFNRVFIVWEPDAPACIQRAVSLGQSHMVPVIERMAAEFEAPSSAEGPCFAPPYVI